MGTLYFFGDSNMKERRGIMYEQLIEELNAHPAHGYNIEDAEKLADKILELGGYKDTLGRTPIVKIVNNFGFSAFKEQNMPKNISGNIFIGGTTKEIYHMTKLLLWVLMKSFIINDLSSHMNWPIISWITSEMRNMQILRSYFLWLI